MSADRGTGLYALDGVRPIVPADGSAWIAPNAAVIGRVTLGQGVSIWFGAVLRGDDEAIAIGDRSNVQDNAVLHADPGLPLLVGKDVTIGHHATLHGCVIEDNVLIGMGACVMNGARIGRNSVVGAGALVTEGKQYPENSFILGSPAKVVRAVDEDIANRIRANAELYVNKARRYGIGLE
jgi:carbonic anhydrase/acetyltransferase-like protein (isoleucine patch superfamily)